MTVINIETTQNVAVHYQLAGIGSRILAYIIDFGILLAYLIMMVIFLNHLTTLNFLDGGDMVVFRMLTLILPFVLYDLFSEVFFNGQSVGKRTMGIKVIKIDGSKPSIGSYLIRWSTRILECIIVFGGVVPIMAVSFSEKGQRLGDIMAGTTVIRTQKTDTLMKNPMDLIRKVDEYEAKYPEAINLSDNDVRVIRRALDAYKYNRNRAPIDAVTLKVEEIIGVKNKERPIEFLIRVIKDYNQLIIRSVE